MKKQLLFLVLLFFVMTGTWAATITVGPGGAPTYNYATIQAAISAASPSDIINVYPGTYLESNILVDKDNLTIQGVGASRDNVIVAPANYDNHLDNAFTSAQNGFIIKAQNVTIRKLTINGNGNAALTSPLNNYRAAIVTLDPTQAGGGTWNNLHVDNVYIKNVWRRGISVFPRDVSGTIIENSMVDSVAYNQGMYLAGHSQVFNNTVKHCFQGIVQNPDISTPAGLYKINGNILSEIGNFAGCFGYPNGQPRAIQFDPVDPSYKTVEIKNNVIDDIGYTGNIGTVGIYTRRASSTSVISNNVISLSSGASHGGSGGAQAVGMILGWSYTNGFMVSTNTVTVTGYGLGILVFGSGTAANPMTLEENVLTSIGSTHTEAGDGTGIYIANQYLFGASNKYGAYVLIQNRNRITGFAKGIDLDKIVTPANPITVIAHNNYLVNNPIGIDASTMGATVNVTDNWWGDHLTNSIGPRHATLNPTGSLTTWATDYDSFIPWWCDEAMTGKCSPGGTPFVIMNLSRGMRYDGTMLATALAEALTGETLYIDGIADAKTMDIAPVNPKTVTIVGKGTPGGSVITGASTLVSGNLIISDIEFTNTTPNPTILVTGGTLNLRKCTINESTGYDQVGLRVSAGTVDAGTLADHGFNKFRVNGSGSAIKNDLSLILANKWYAIGNDWGSHTGPTVSTNPGGVGGAILTSVSGGIDYVIYRPWGGITMSGNFHYYNLANTALTNGITVKLYQNNNQIGSDYTVTAGTYSFSDLVSGDYEVRMSSTKTTDGSVNATDAAQVNYWGPHPYTIEKVRFYAGDVTGDVFYINSTDALRIQKNFVYGTEFDRPSWTFWETGKTISSNTSPSESYPIVNVGGGNKTANMYGLCTGDFNRSFTPGLKSGNSNLILNYGLTQQVGISQEFDLPVRIVNASGVGAISLIFNFPSDLVNVMDVRMIGNSGKLDWIVNGNELRIGWNSQIPVAFAALENLITLRMKTTNSFIKGNSFRLALAADPLNELADEMYNVIGNGILEVDVIEASPNGVSEQIAGNTISIRNYPNPFVGHTLIAYSLPFNGTVRIEIRNILGETVTLLVNESQVKGDHSLTFDAGSLPAGVYTATIKLSGKSDELISTIKIVINR